VQTTILAPGVAEREFRARIRKKLSDAGQEKLLEDLDSNEFSDEEKLEIFRTLKAVIYSTADDKESEKRHSSSTKSDAGTSVNTSSDTTSDERKSH
jgi:hypothetical protein